MNAARSVAATGRSSCAKLLFAVADSPEIRVMMCPTTVQVPQEILDAAQRHVEDMARELGGIDRQSAFWSSLRESGLSLEVLGWKFKFHADGDALVLAQVDPVPPQQA